MSDSTQVQLIKKALEEAKGEDVEIQSSTDLIAEEVIDSLDSALFLVELEKLSGVQIPQADVTERELFKVENMVNYLNEKQC